MQYKYDTFNNIFRRMMDASDPLAYISSESKIIIF